MGARRAKTKFNSQDFDFDQVNRDIRASSKASSIYVGADSQVGKKKGQVVVNYVTTIILHKDSKHGGVIFKDVKTMPFYGSMRERLMNEVGFAVDAALNIVDAVGDRHFEVHLDINPKLEHKSSVLVKEAMGYVMGVFGFAAKVKPEAFAASTVADRFTK